MRLPWLPRSLNGFLLLGLALVAVPLLIAIAQAMIQMRQLTTASQRLVLESVQTTRLAAQDLFGEISSLERAARLYTVLGDSNVLASFRDHDQRLDTAITQLESRVPMPEGRAAIVALRENLQTVRAMMRPGLTGKDAEALDARFVTLGEQAVRLSSSISVRIDAELAALESQTTRARRQLIWESALIAPIVLLAVLAVTFGLSRPLRQVDRAIGELGAGDFAHRIAVTGPIDVVRLGDQLEWLRNRLLDLAQERNRFLRHMSHELKTPLANIREGTELLMDGAVGPLDSGQREVAAILQDNGIKLQRMIENLLSFSAWQSNMLKLEVSEFRLRPLIKQVLENQQLTLVSQRVRLEVQVEELALEADRGKLRLILENLLSNAIKYSPRGGVIYLHARAEGENLLLEIADTGTGIPMAERAHIFDAFYTGRAPGGHVKGTGIGLSVVHEFVAVHGGSVRIVDGTYPGAHFQIRIPIRRPGDEVKADAA